MNHWLKIYAKNANTEVPALEGRIRSIESDIQTSETRLKNLISRIADIPAEIEADGFYNQIKELKTKTASLKTVKADLLSKTKVMNGKIIDQSEFEKKLIRVIANLEKTPAEERKPIYQNVLQFAELHSNKIRIGLYAPTKGVEIPDSLGATGTDDFKFYDFEPKKRSSRVNSGGSTTVTYGGGCVKLQELGGPVISVSYKAIWEREYLDLTELARLRWVEGYKIKQLSDYFGVSQVAVKERLRSIKKNPKRAGIKDIANIQGCS